MVFCVELAIIVVSSVVTRIVILKLKGECYLDYKFKYSTLVKIGILTLK